VIASGKPKMLEFGVADETAWNVGPVLRRHHPRLRREGGPIVKLETLTQVNVERAARRPVIVITDTANGEQRLVKAKDIATDPLSAELSKQLRMGKSGMVESGGKKAVPQCLRADRTPRHCRRGPYQPGAGAAGAFARLRRDGGRSAHRLCEPRAFSDVPLIAEWPDVGAAAAQHRSLHGVRRRSRMIPRSTIRRCCMRLRRDCFYIGALGSRKTHAKRAERLKAQGASDADIARIHAPIGLSIGAVSPSEIAVSIMAEITAELRLPKETAKVQAA
jgi:xanthine dehydrogenase accessory factor